MEGVSRGGSGRFGFAWDYLMSQARRDVVVLSDRRSERVSELALSPDGQTLATADVDGTIRLRDPDTGRSRSLLTGHRIAVSRLAFASDGRRLASVGREGQAMRSEVLVWDLPSGKLAGRLEEPLGRAVTDVSFDPSGQFLWEVARVEDGHPRLGLWNVAAGVDHPRMAWTRPIRAEMAPISLDGGLVAIEEEPRRIVVRDVRGKERGRTGSLDLEPMFAAPSPDGRFLAIAGRQPSCPPLGSERRTDECPVRTPRRGARTFVVQSGRSFPRLRFPEWSLYDPRSDRRCEPRDTCRGRRSRCQDQDVFLAR